eukprot:CAMPEP_0194265398 /NCGR_PEP_ID=MMETSP0169-20130528/652_1 /TAXON_ID=218684 /ORGANISM="Corethron pennatum, Strain L29A3" /LENGTH=307 /DNA_ID=CAMNT_0039005853 /DNA_START=158 /DNA_END=1081 /DNA_ORIENTATION=+
MAVNYKTDYDNSPIESGDLGESSMPANLKEEATIVDGSTMTTDSFSADNERDEDCPVESDKHGESSISININGESKLDVGILSKRPIPALTTSTSNQSKPKKARTAYFIFASYKREEAKKANPGKGVTEIAKTIGTMWSSISASEKEKYRSLAAEEKKSFALNAPSPEDQQQIQESSEIDPSKLIFPSSKTRSIMKLDPEVKGVSKEGVLLLTKSAEIFTSLMGTEVLKIARQSNRRTILVEDIALACQRGKFAWLKDDIRDLVKTQESIKEAEKEARLEMKKISAGVSGEMENVAGNTLLNYFTSK